MADTSSSTTRIDRIAAVPDWEKHSYLTRLAAITGWLVERNPSDPISSAALDLLAREQAHAAERMGLSRMLDHVREGGFIVRFGKGLVQR